MKAAATTADLLHKLGNDLASKRTLLIDRYPNARSSLRMTLSAMGVTAVHNASSSAEVLRQVRAHTFDIILSDYLLEDGRDGQQLLEELRQQNLVPLSTVFMIVTSERAYRNVVSVAELSPDDYLIKPFTADDLHGRLVRAIYRKQFLALTRRTRQRRFRACPEHLRADARRKAASCMTCCGTRERSEHARAASRRAGRL